MRGLPLPDVTVVDMRRELEAGNRSIFSQLLIERLGECLRAGRQAMLFLNRRGYNTFVSCRSCGYVVKCERCGRIAHMCCDELPALYRHLAQEHGFTVDPNRTLLYGTCHDCAQTGGEGHAAD